MRNFELQRDKEFTSHGCAEQPTQKRLKRETESGRATLSSAVAEGRSGSPGMSPAALKRIVDCRSSESALGKVAEGTKERLDSRSITLTTQWFRDGDFSPTIRVAHLPRVIWLELLGGRSRRRRTSLRQAPLCS